MKVSLTFDNGPDLNVTPHVLDTLARHDVRATFFALGKNLAVPEKRDLALRALAEGHRLGNHSFNHATPFGLLDRPAEAVEEILATDRLLEGLRGPERLFRPFGRGQIGPHLLNRAAWNALIEGEFTCVLWTQLAYEQQRPDSWMEPTVTACAREPWSVAVLHDVSVTAAMRHLEAFLDMLKDRGAEFSQEFPDDCVPLRHGRIVGRYQHLMPIGDSPDGVPPSHA